jgi:hypothetical protein
MRPHRTRRALAGLATGLLAGCRGAGPAGPVCAPTLGEAVAIGVRDARTGAPLAAGARGAVAEAAFVDSLRPMPLESPAGRTLVGGGDRAGTYTVTVERAGYRPWRADAVRVTRGACGVSTVGLVAALEAAP